MDEGTCQCLVHVAFAADTEAQNSLQVLKEWQQNKPELFNKRVINHPGLNS